MTDKPLQEWRGTSVAELVASGNWISAPRKWKRKLRRDKQAWQNVHATQPSEVYRRKSKGWRTHIRRMKAKQK